MEQKLAQLQAKLEADKSLGEKLFNLETPEEVQSLLKEQGLAFSLEEINSVRDALVKVAQKGELADEALEGVAGGSAAVVIAGIGVGIQGAEFLDRKTSGNW